MASAAKGERRIGRSQSPCNEELLRKKAKRKEPLLQVHPGALEENTLGMCHEKLNEVVYHNADWDQTLRDSDLSKSAEII